MIRDSFKENEELSKGCNWRISSDENQNCKNCFHHRYLSIMPLMCDYLLHKQVATNSWSVCDNWEEDITIEF